MFKLTGSIMPLGLVAYLLPLNCPCMSSLLTLCNKLLTTETQNQGGHLNSLESARRGTRGLLMQHEGREWVEGRSEVLYCLDFLSPLASLFVSKWLQLLSSPVLYSLLALALLSMPPVWENRLPSSLVLRSFAHPFSCLAMLLPKKSHQLHAQPFYYYPLSSSATISTLLLISCFTGITYVHALDLTCPRSKYRLCQVKLLTLRLSDRAPDRQWAKTEKNDSALKTL